MTELHYQSALAIGARIQAGELSAEAVTRALLERIEERGDLNAFARLDPALSLDQAVRADEEIRAGKIRSPLHGVPIALKDLLATREWPTASGTTIYRNHVPAYDATVVTRLREAGTITLGKLQLTEGAFSRHHPEVAIPRNPFDPDCWAGVSSSGSGVATAAGLCFASLGTDTGGSIRFPSAANGIVGLKPTWGRVSRFGAFPLAYSLDHIGPMTRSVADAAAMLRIIAGFDEQDATSSREPVPDYLADAAHVPPGLRVGVDWGYVEGGTAPEQVSAVRAVADLLAAHGHQLVDVVIPYHAVSAQWPVTTAVEALHAHRETWPGRKAEYGSLGDLLELGESFSAQDYMLAELSRREFVAHLAGEWARCDVMLCPSYGLYAPPREGTPEMDEAEGDLAETLKFTAPFDASGSPTLSIPWHAGPRRVPTSIQLIGRDFDEATLVGLGMAIETWRGPLVHPE
jgi:amidase